MLKKNFFFFLFGLGVFVAVLLWNTVNFNSQQKSFKEVNRLEVGKESINSLAEAVKIKTISTEDVTDFDTTAFLKFASFLSEKYPLVDSFLEKKTFNSFSFLYRWKGKREDLSPIVLMGHLDVVPAEKNSLKSWNYQPFSGTIEKGNIWGRGTLDDKCNVIGILEAANALLKNGFIPERTIYFAFGHDEEVGGGNGAKEMAKYLENNGVRAEFVLDEGLAITQNMVPGIDSPVALIGIAEKGFMTLKLSVNAEGGHSSMPEKETAIGILSHALHNLNKELLPSTISKPVESFMNFIGPEMPFIQKIVFANYWLFEPIILKIYEKTGSGSALVRTTAAPTIISGGIKENVIPTQATALVNFRILSGENSSLVIERVKNIIANEKVKVEVYGEIDEPSKISGVNTMGFNCVHRTIKQIYPTNTIVTPSLVLGITDSRHFSSVAENIYRFSPIVVNPENKSAIHGINECISVDDFSNTIRFYYQLIVNINELSSINN